MIFNNSRVRKPARNPPPFKIALAMDDHKKLVAFVALLAQIDKRISANGNRLWLNPKK